MGLAQTQMLEVECVSSRRSLWSTPNYRLFQRHHRETGHKRTDEHMLMSTGIISLGHSILTDVGPGISVRGSLFRGCCILQRYISWVVVPLSTIAELYRILKPGVEYSCPFILGGLTVRSLGKVRKWSSMSHSLQDHIRFGERERRGRENTTSILKE